MTLVGRLIERTATEIYGNFKLVRYLLTMLVCLMLAALPRNADARRATKDDGAQQDLEWNIEAPRLRIAQGGGMSLSDAIDSVRSRGNVERIISAETKVSGGREVHYIKVLTKDGKVQTHKVQGRKVG